MRVLHINLNYVGTRLFQKMMQYFKREPELDNLIFVPICDITEINIVPEGDEIIVDCFKKRDRYLYSYKQKKIFKALKDNVDIDNVDICHTYTVFSDGNSAYKLNKKKGIPYIVTVRDTDINVFFKKMFWLRNKGNQILDKASAVVFLSTAYKDFTLSKYVKPELRKQIESKAEIIPNGVDEYWHMNSFTGRDYEEIENRLKKRQIKLLFVGLLNYRKNIEGTLAAVEELSSRGWNVKFTVVGKVVNEEVQQKVMNSKYTKYVGEQPKEEVIKEYRDADIFVMPSTRETFGLTYAEAMTQGLPVIYTKGQGFDGQFEEGKVGFCVDPYSPTDIADKIEKICSQYRCISLNCVKGSKKFDWEVISNQYFRIYKELGV